MKISLIITKCGKNKAKLKWLTLVLNYYTTAIINYQKMIQIVKKSSISKLTHIF